MTLELLMEKVRGHRYLFCDWYIFSTYHHCLHKSLDVVSQYFKETKSTK